MATCSASTAAATAQAAAQSEAQALQVGSDIWSDSARLHHSVTSSLATTEVGASLLAVQLARMWICRTVVTAWHQPRQRLSG